jgi:hypothetical protein
MSINMEPFGWEAISSKPAPSEALPKRMFPYGLSCRGCGYEPEDLVVAPRQKCPKCSGSSWERYTRPGSLLDDAERRSLEHASQH